MPRRNSNVHAPRREPQHKTMSDLFNQLRQEQFRKRQWEKERAEERATERRIEQIRRTYSTR